MILPEYNGRSIVNLVSTIQKACGSNPVYPLLKNLSPEILSEKQNILLIVLDGLGYEYLTDYGKGTIFTDHLESRLTSVFPSTTASAITTFASGVAPLEHAITGWFMYFKEVGAASLVLPFCPRFSGKSYSMDNLNPEDFFNFPSIYSDLDRDSYVVTVDYIKDSPYNSYALKGTIKSGYKKISQFSDNIVKVISKGKNKKFVYAYWSEFDKNSHRYGINSEETFKHFKHLEKVITKLVKKLKGTDTICLITADHGLIDTIPERVISMDYFPEMREMMILPLCGEPRVPYCYVKAGKKNDFQYFVEQNLSDVCNIYPSEDIISKGMFGLKEENPKLRDRIGDFTLIMKESYVLHDWVLGETPFKFTGYHGNLTPEEMYVPLIKIMC